MSSTYTVKNNPFSRFTKKHSQLDTFSQPYFNRIFSICLSHNSPAKGWPHRFRSRRTTGSSTLDHDFGHLCRGRRIQMSGHSDLGIFNDIGAACDLRAPHRLTRPAFEVHPGAITFPPEGSSQRRSSNGPIRFPHHLFGDHDHGRQRSDREPQLFPALTLAWLYIEPSPCGRVRPARDPVDSDPGVVFEDDPHPRSDGGRPLEPWVCHHTREPTVLSRVSCRPFHLNIDLFHQPCLLPWRTPYCHRNTAGLGRDRWGMSSPYPVATTYPCGQPGSPSFATHSRYCHADWTEPRQDVNSSFTPCVCHSLRPRCLHTRMFGTLASPPPPVEDMPWGPHLPGHLPFWPEFKQYCINCLSCASW